MSAIGRELDAPHSKPATTLAPSTRASLGMDWIHSREPIPFKFPATSSPGAEHDNTIIQMINDNSSWADIEAVAGAEAFDRYYTMLDPDLEAFWDNETMVRLNSVVWGYVQQGNKPGDSSLELGTASATTTTTATATATLAPTATDLAVLADGLPWEKIAGDMNSSAEVCKHIWSTFGDGRPLSEQERVLLAMEEKRRRRRMQVEKQERERIAAEEEQARIRAEKQEQERMAEQREQARIKAEKQEQERMAEEKELARIKAEKQEQERIATEKEKARIKAEKQERGRAIKAAKEQAKEERERVSLEKKRTGMRLRAEEKQKQAQASTLVESEGTKSSTSVAVDLVIDNVQSNEGDAGLSHFEADVTTRHQRTRLQAQFTKIHHNKTLLQQESALRRHADELRQQQISTLLARQAACKIVYNKLIENENIPVPYQDAGNDDNKDTVIPGKHNLVRADNDCPTGGLTCTRALYNSRPFKRSFKRLRSKSQPIFVPRFKEVLQQAEQKFEQQAEQRRQANSQRRNQAGLDPSKAGYVQYVYVRGVGLVRTPVPGGSQATVDHTDARKCGSGASPRLQAIPTASDSALTGSSLTNTVAGANPGYATSTSLPSDMPPREDAMKLPDKINARPNPYYDILTWTSEDIGGVWNFWVQYGDKWDDISKTVLSGRHSPQECRAFVMGAGFF